MGIRWYTQNNQFIKLKNSILVQAIVRGLVSLRYLTLFLTLKPTTDNMLFILF